MLSSPGRSLGRTQASARTAVAAALVAVLLAGCTAAPASVPPTRTLIPLPTASAEPLGEFGAPGCTPASPLAAHHDPDFQEVQGTTAKGESLYGWIMAETPLRVSEGDAKLVWRITGSGDLSVVATRPDGSTAALAWGPEPHSGSNYHRPGEEWGTGIVFDVPGCWELDFTRGGLAASVYLDIAA